MVDILATVRLASLVAVAASVPLSLVAAWGFRSAPVGGAVAALPVVSVGFLVSASAEVLGTTAFPWDSAWAVGGIAGSLGFVWLAVAFTRLVSGHQRVGR